MSVADKTFSQMFLRADAQHCIDCTETKIVRFRRHFGTKNFDMENKTCNILGYFFAI